MLRFRLKKGLYVLSWLVIGCVLLHVPLFAQNKKKAAKPQPPVAADKSGKLVYAIAPNGDRIPDYSYCGYMASENRYQKFRYA